MIERVSEPIVSYSTRIAPLEGNKNINASNNQDTLPNTDHNKKEKLDKIVESMNEFLQPSNTSLKFELHEKLNEYYVTIVDDVTHEVIKEIPSKKMLDMYAAMTDFVGLMVDKKI
ncbi:flagellar protein FlaG [Peribacillus cavernae]|uniref:Flagellar protein FlaG n=1 Tax=Peribacillus cavernae TaxID=1674310 RepID=A0A3S0UGZ4_9BACI|nr:flagellar protein FlaG [Peribacillus cavernae]MDQ0218401.1 flagellar protein FlaG [Peribacillus cavernae]RUQ31406.1 flagellar protein FlaG [Peribacillus cavernae]